MKKFFAVLAVAGLAWGGSAPDAPALAAMTTMSAPDPAPDPAFGAEAVLAGVAPGLALLPPQSNPSNRPARKSPLGDAPPVDAVRRENGLWVIDARGVSRAALARQLAALSGSGVHDAQAVLSTLRPLSRKWRGASLHEAWLQVLNDDASHALRCGPARCDLWLVASSGSGAPARARATGGDTAPAASSGPSEPIAAPAAEVPLTPDPPGLFPSD